MWHIKHGSYWSCLGSDWPGSKAKIDPGSKSIIKPEFHFLSTSQLWNWLKRQHWSCNKYFIKFFQLFGNTHTVCHVYRAQGGWRTQLAHSLRSLARFRLRGPRSFAPAPGAPVSQASGLLLVLLDQDYQANTPPHVRTHLQYKRARQWARFGLAPSRLWYNLPISTSFSDKHWIEMNITTILGAIWEILQQSRADFSSF